MFGPTRYDDIDTYDRLLACSDPGNSVHLGLQPSEMMSLLILHVV